MRLISLTFFLSVLLTFFELSHQFKSKNVIPKVVSTTRKSIQKIKDVNVSESKISTDNNKDIKIIESEIKKKKDKDLTSSNGISTKRPFNKNDQGNIERDSMEIDNVPNLPDIDQIQKPTNFKDKSGTKQPFNKNDQENIEKDSIENWVDNFHDNLPNLPDVNQIQKPTNLKDKILNIEESAQTGLNYLEQNIGNIFDRINSKIGYDNNVDPTSIIDNGIPANEDVLNTEEDIEPEDINDKKVENTVSDDIPKIDDEEVPITKDDLDDTINDNVEDSIDDNTSEKDFIPNDDEIKNNHNIDNINLPSMQKATNTNELKESFIRSLKREQRILQLRFNEEKIDWTKHKKIVTKSLKELLQRVRSRIVKYIDNTQKLYKKTTDPLKLAISQYIANIEIFKNLVDKLKSNANTQYLDILRRFQRDRKITEDIYQNFINETILKVNNTKKVCTEINKIGIEIENFVNNAISEYKNCQRKMPVKNLKLIKKLKNNLSEISNEMLQSFKSVKNCKTGSKCLADWKRATSKLQKLQNKVNASEYKNYKHDLEKVENETSSCLRNKMEKFLLDRLAIEEKFSQCIS